MKKLSAILILLTPRLSLSSLACTGIFSSTEITVLPSQINDDFCDCADGSDELTTNACAGVFSWAGAGGASSADSDDYTKNRYKCPEQQLFLPLSRLNDGICDCCDGSDEQSTSHCTDICDSVLAAERMQKKMMLDNYNIGSEKRNEGIAEFKRITKETFEEMEELRTKLGPLQKLVDKKEKEFKIEKDAALLRHFDSMNRIIGDIRSNEVFDNVLKIDHDMMVEIIAASCELYGEWTLAESKNTYDKDQLCEPLRRAALDVGLLWKGDMVKSGSKEDIADAFMIDAGMKTDSSQREEENWKDPEDDILDGTDDVYHDDYVEGFEDDDELAHINAEMDRNKNEKKKENDKQSSSGTKVFKAKFGRLMRTEFFNNAEKIMTRIDGLLEDEEDAEDADGTGPDKEVEEGEKSEMSPDVDPMAIQMVRNKLSGRMSQLEYGDKLASSSFTMIDSLKESVDPEEFAKYLEKLLIGTINLSKIGEADLMEILAVLSVDVSEETCYSPYTDICGAEEIKDSVATRCAERSNVNHCVDLEEKAGLPSDIPDGYYGYYVSKRRDEDDSVSKSFGYYDANIFDKSNLKEIELALDEAKKEMTELNDKIKKLKDGIGMKKDENGPKYGLNGELYGIRDECFDIKAGKYTYEICMFGRAAQREGSATKGGTDLGKWKSASVDEETGSRVWRWTGGAKCWNGPKRSATVFVTCGQETKLLSADEPNICEYEFRMESYIACDAAYRAANDF